MNILNGFGERQYEKIDDSLAMDIQDAIGRESSLSLVASNIRVSVDRDIVTLAGEVFRETEKRTAGYIATTYTGEDSINNNLEVVYKVN